MLNHTGTKVIETPRLILRPFKISDASMMYQNWASDDEVTKYLTWPTHSDIFVTKTILQMWVEGYKNKDYYQWAIELKKTGEVIGSLSLFNINNHDENAEVGYCISRDYWNQGIVTEAFNGLIKLAFEEIGFARLTARHDVLNPASGRVMEKCGLTYEGTLRKISKNQAGQLVDGKCYSILKEEYKEKRFYFGNK